jgi:hypothetical protein
MDEYWLLRPIMDGFYTYKELKDGSLSLYDIALCNDCIEIKLYNENLR